MHEKLTMIYVQLEKIYDSLDSENEYLLNALDELNKAIAKEDGDIE